MSYQPHAINNVVLKEITGICKEPGCGKEFGINSDEASFYASKGLALPKRCASCRSKRKQERLARQTYGED